MRGRKMVLLHQALTEDSKANRGAGRITSEIER